MKRRWIQMLYGLLVAVATLCIAKTALAQEESTDFDMRVWASYVDQVEQQEEGSNENLDAAATSAATEMARSGRRFRRSPRGRHFGPPKSESLTRIRFSGEGGASAAPDQIELAIDALSSRDGASTLIVESGPLVFSEEDNAYMGSGMASVEADGEIQTVDILISARIREFGDNVLLMGRFRSMAASTEDSNEVTFPRLRGLFRGKSAAASEEGS